VSSEDNFTYSSVSAAIERPSKRAEIRIFLVDPTGQRPTVVWHSDQGSLIECQETIVARILRILRIRP
jgi:hypothetical protein